MSGGKEGKHFEHHEQNGVPAHLTTVTLTAEQFESLYLQPRASAPQFSLAGRLGNPTALGVTSFLVGLLPLSMDLMEFQSASRASAITLLGVFYGISGIGCYLAAIMEWLIGNTFPFIAFAAFGGFWISYAILNQPTFGIAASFATPDQATSVAAAIAAGSATTDYNSGLGMYFLSWGVLLFILLVASLRTNVAFVGIFVFLTIGFMVIAAAYFKVAYGHLHEARRLLKVGGASLFIVCLLAIWVDFSLLFAAVDWPIRIPLIDLSHMRRRRRDAADQA